MGLKIALIQSFLPSRSQGGVGHFTHQFANCLAGRGHVVTVFTLDPAPEDAAYTVRRPAPTDPLCRGKLGRLFGFALWIARQDFSPYAIVHAQGDNHFLRTRRPVIRTIHGSALAEAWHARRLRTKAMYLMLYPLELIGVARANRAVGVSRNTLRHFPWVTLAFGQGVSAEFHPGGTKSPYPSILFVGHRLHDRKRAYLLLDAFQREIRPAIPEAELWLVCDETVVAPGVRCRSNLPLAELAELYRHAWVFCLPSSYEGFGRPYLEAMASGTPVAATPNPGANEILQNGRFGVLAPPHLLGQAMVDLLTDPYQRHDIARRSQAEADKYRWEAVVDCYEQIYLKVAEERNSW